ncbi:MAG: hypothetical protein Q9201_004231 [Fulgogasparrea decipioides]
MDVQGRTLGNYVPAACWSAAEPSIAVVSACLPSLRPLFVRVVWGGTHRPRPPPSTHRSMSSWRSNRKQSKSGVGGTEGSFNRLQELSGDHGGARTPWRTNSVNVLGGKNKGSDEMELTGSDHEVTPWNRIRAKTEVVLTISDRVDWQDDLF